MWQTKAVAPSFRPFIINNLHCVEVVQPLLLLSIDTLRLLSASPLPFLPPPPPPPPMNTLVTCVFLVRSDDVAGDGRRHGDATDAALAVAVAGGSAGCGCGRGRLREVMTLIMTFLAAKTVLPFRPSFRPSASAFLPSVRSSVVFSIRPLHHHQHHHDGISGGRSVRRVVRQETGHQDGDRPPSSVPSSAPASLDGNFRDGIRVVIVVGGRWMKMAGSS